MRLPLSERSVSWTGLPPGASDGGGFPKQRSGVGKERKGEHCFSRKAGTLEALLLVPPYPGHECICLPFIHGGREGGERHGGAKMCSCQGRQVHPIGSAAARFLDGPRERQRLQEEGGPVGGGRG